MTSKLHLFVIALTCFVLLIAPVAAAEEIQKIQYNDTKEVVHIGAGAAAIETGVLVGSGAKIAIDGAILAYRFCDFGWVNSVDVILVAQSIKKAVLVAGSAAWLLLGTAIIAGECYGIYKILDQDPHAFDGLEQTYSWGFDYP